MARIDALLQTNSTSYTDVTGVELGFNRLLGEETTRYLERLREAAAYQRSHNYEGALTQVSLELGISLQEGIAVSHGNPLAQIDCSPAGIVVTNNSSSVTVPVVSMDGDNVWSWRMLSDVAADLNSLEGATANLLTDDGPALQIATQSNAAYVVNELVLHQKVVLSKPSVVVGTVLFNQPVPKYTLTADGVLEFTQHVPDGLLVSYQYRSWPYTVITSQVALMGMLDSGFPSIAAAGSDLAYQVREALQFILDVDRSYWSK